MRKNSWLSQRIKEFALWIGLLLIVLANAVSVVFFDITRFKETFSVWYGLDYRNSLGRSFLAFALAGVFL